MLRRQLSSDSEESEEEVIRKKKRPSAPRKAKISSPAPKVTLKKEQVEPISSASEEDEVYEEEEEEGEENEQPETEKESVEKEAVEKSAKGKSKEKETLPLSKTPSPKVAEKPITSSSTAVAVSKEQQEVCNVYSLFFVHILWIDIPIIKP